MIENQGGENERTRSLKLICGEGSEILALCSNILGIDTPLSNLLEAWSSGIDYRTKQKHTMETQSKTLWMRRKRRKKNNILVEEKKKSFC